MKKHLLFSLILASSVTLPFTAFAAKLNKNCRSVVTDKLKTAEEKSERAYKRELQRLDAHVIDRIDNAAKMPGRNFFERMVLSGKPRLILDDAPVLGVVQDMPATLERASTINQTHTNLSAILSIQRLFGSKPLANEAAISSPYAIPERPSDVGPNGYANLSGKPPHLSASGRAEKWPFRAQIRKQDIAYKKKGGFEHGFSINLVAGPGKDFKQKFPEIALRIGSKTKKGKAQIPYEFFAFDPVVVTLINVGVIDVSEDNGGSAFLSPLPDASYQTGNKFESEKLNEIINWAFERTKNRFSNRSYVNDPAELILEVRSFEQALSSSLNELSSYIVAVQLTHPEAPWGAIEENLYFLQQLHKGFEKFLPEAFTPNPVVQLKPKVYK